MKARTCYVIKEGEFYSSKNRVYCVCRTKEIAHKKCKADGFTYSAEDGLWFGTKWKKRYYREIVPNYYYD